MKLLTILATILLVVNMQAHAVTIVPAPPKVNASSYVVMDFHSGERLVDVNIEKRLPQASLTKIMTVYIVAMALADGTIALDDEVLVSEKAWRTGGSKMFIEVNKKISVDDLLNGVIIQSGNDASIALAEYLSGTEERFAVLMNKQARRLGMNNTHYVNSTGLPHSDHYSTAWDLAILARAMIRDFPVIYSRHKIKEFTFNGIKQYNRNKLLWNDHSVDGLKTGHTEAAGYCLVASSQRDNMRLISVVLGSGSASARIKASQDLLNYSYRFYETRKLYSAGERISDPKVWYADVETVALGVIEDVYLTLTRGQYDNLQTTINIFEPVLAPIKQGDKKGQLEITTADQKVKIIPLQALETIAESGFFKRVKDKIRLLFY